MLVSIVIVNYNTFKVTCDCIESVIQHTKEVDYEIILVDNASKETDPEEFARKFPNIVLIKNPENTGFAGGNNLGIQHAKGDVILLLNSDTIILDDSISIAAKQLAADKICGAITVHLTYADGKYQHNARKFRSLRNEILDLLRPLLYLLPYRKRAVLMLNQYFKGDFDTTVDWVSGAFMMFRKDVLNALPGKKLDERFFMYGEDHLWGYQIKQAGFENRFLSNVKVIHIANVSTEPAKQLKLLKLMMQRELEIMRYRKGKSLYYCAFSILFTFKENLRYLVKYLTLKIFGYRIR